MITFALCFKQLNMMIENPPHIKLENLQQALISDKKESVANIVDEINGNFDYWDKVKYKIRPKDFSAEQLWTYVKADRLKHQICVWEKYGVVLSITNKMQRLCHNLDMNWGGFWGSDSVVDIDNSNKKRFLLGSLMEEAIFSSQMEGAATTRKVAKEMLRKKMTPKDKSQQMIVNNYQTIQYIVQHKESDLSAEKLLQIHRLMTEHTMDNEEDSGRFRINNDIVVENGITHSVVHTPPEYSDIPEFIDSLCKFFNDKKPKLFIHPVIRAIIIHFMIAFVHPFSDGNGRTARALFYWYMLKQGYWLTEYLSISRVIAKSKKSYEKSFLYTEADGLDIGYFVNYNLNVLEQSFFQLQQYIKRKQEEKNSANRFLRIGNINERQAQIINIFENDSDTVITVKDIQIKFGISPTTAKKDIADLVDRKILSEISFNKVKKGYIKGSDFDRITQ